MAAYTQATKNIIILGPSMASGNTVLDAIHALYYLPEYFTLVLTGSNTADQSFFSQVQQLVEQSGLGHRVTFQDDMPDAQAVILPVPGMSRVANSVAGDSPEAIASALLNLFRSHS
jgi:hypothetical protein